ncbi:iron chelate uptake ABC transporter family permease subunit [Nibribacter ruber]|uniref:Iron chelate uptake ABC transporter family permease subunit n=1 Tax=Nibribacter ruber TaxID=2698458 RepID=A0A6P1NT83_9BACT|nr:iron ABC transporter permease [Nibribacter ruber]QHL87086.1 iron chelate uptake ABC transporter family permease subunit [Nibribacter ruber]
MLAVVLLLVFGFFLGLKVGSIETSYSLIWEALTHYNSEDSAHYSIVHLRLPRLLLAFLTGASLAFAGYLMQALVNNALADPYLMGTASGASLGASFSLFFLTEFTVMGLYLPPFFALVGSFAVTLVVVILGSRRGQLIPSQMLLVGVALSSLLTALVSLIMFLSDSESQLKSVVFWSMGGFEKADWTNLGYPATALIAGLIIFQFLQKHLSVLLLGAERAETLGVEVGKLRWVMLLAISVVTGFAVAFSGPVGFVGLMIPHVTRAVLGITNRFNLIFCALAGGLFLVLCDILSRLLYPPAGMPVGIVTSFFGVPFFVYLLRRKNYRFS